MRDALKIVGQVALSLLVAGAVMPLLLISVPATQMEGAFPFVIVGVIGVCFGLIRLAWPSRKS